MLLRFESEKPRGRVEYGSHMADGEGVFVMLLYAFFIFYHPSTPVRVYSRRVSLSPSAALDITAGFSRRHD